VFYVFLHYTGMKRLIQTVRASGEEGELEGEEGVYRGLDLE
jgi:hypothetical protein